MSPDNWSGILNVALGALPSILALIRGSVPAGQPVPTDAEMLAALQSAVTSSLAIDENWKRSHPVDK